MSQPIYALNLFNIADREEYLAYSRRSAREVQAHGGRVVALGKFRESAAGDVEPRTVLILVEWASKEDFDSYRSDPKLADLHPHRVKGAGDYIWHLFDKLEDLRPILSLPPKQAAAARTRPFPLCSKAMSPPGAWSTAEGAASWQASAAQRQQSLAAVTDLMLEQTGIGPGMRVLDVGAGTGDLALLLAGRVGPEGSVLATDVSASMLEVATRLAGEAGLSNVETLTVRAEDLDLPRASFDAALSRNCLMFVDDLPRALRAVRSALRPGARFAASVWGLVERNVFHGAPMAAVRKRRAIPTPQPEVVRAFSMPGGGAVADALRDAGFARVETRTVPAPRRFPSLEEAVRSARGFPTFVALLQLLSEAEREQVWSEVARDWQRFATSAGLELPGEQVVISAAA